MNFGKVIFSYVLFCLCSFFLGGCIYLDHVSDINNVANHSWFGYSKEITINSDPQGAYVIIMEDGTYKTLGQTPLKYFVDLNKMNTFGYKVVLSSPGYHPQEVRLIDGDYRCIALNNSRKSLTGSFIMDCFLVFPIPFDILFGLPIYASIPDEAFTCDYLGAKVVYANETIKLIPNSVQLPQGQVAQGYQEIDTGGEAAALMATAIIQGAASAASQPIGTPPSVQRPVYTPTMKQTPPAKPTYTPKPIPQYRRIPRAPSFGRSGNLPSTDWNTRQNTGLQRVR
jgi:hypothetical protein